jgi:hypothetical protein
MFEIIGDDIASLSDTDLRTLVGLLCETEMRRRAQPTSAVTWGGNQTAKDGGLDVRVNLPVPTEITGFIPAPARNFAGRSRISKPPLTVFAAKLARARQPRYRVECGDKTG